MAARVGHWMDRGFVHRVSVGALLLMLVAWWPLLGLPQSLPWLLLGVIVLDLGGQALHVSNQALLLRAPGEQHGRLVALYMLFYAVGSGAVRRPGPGCRPGMAGLRCACWVPASRRSPCCGGPRGGWGR